MMTLMTKFAALAPKNKDLAKENLVDYQNAVNKVAAYSHAFSNSSLSYLNHPPAGYSAFMDQFGVAKGHTKEWADSIIMNLVSVPQGIVDSNQIIQGKFRNILEDLQDLADDPNDPDVIADLKTNLSRILTRAQDEQKNITSLINQITTYTANLEQDYTTLNAGLTMLNQATQADQETVKRLNDEIAALKEEIKQLNQYLTAAEIGLGVSIFVTAVGVVVGVATGGAGFVISAVGVVGIGASIAGIVLANQKIHADQVKIGQDASALDDYNKDLLVLNAETANLKTLTQANQEACQALEAIGSLWQDLSASTQTLLDTLHQAETDAGNLTNEPLELLKDEINKALAEWNELEKFAQQLTGINYNIDPNVHNLS